MDTMDLQAFLNVYAEGKIKLSKPVEKNSELFHVITRLYELELRRNEIIIAYGEYRTEFIEELKKALIDYRKMDTDMEGIISYTSQYDETKGKWTIDKEKVEDLYGPELYAREANDEVLIKELEKRGFKIKKASPAGENFINSH